ncbi:hypothetical protein K1719_035097 [Acacia pycnantha]|nr:hypothetical protein K1719_035097 [Acacia pycnantha]
MKVSLGAPPSDIIGIEDTESDLIWTQCVPCNGFCKQFNPLFNPIHSSTYKTVSCSSSQCPMLDQETLILKSSTGKDQVSLKNVVFGCGHHYAGTFNDHEMGIIGLGGGSFSLISQMASSFGIKNAFCQCLVPFHTDTRISSKMSFGNGSQVSGNGAVSTPVVSKQDKTPYLVVLNGTSVEGKFIPFNGNEGFHYSARGARRLVIFETNNNL